MPVRVITGTVLKSNSNPETSGKTYKDGKEVKKKKKSSSSSSSSKKTTSAQDAALAAGAGPLSTAAADDFVNSQNVVSPLSSVQEVSGSTISTPTQETPDTGFSYRTEENQANLTKFGIIDEAQAKTLGQTLTDEWNYYKPVIGLALWQSGAAEQVLAKASSVVGNILSKYLPTNAGSKQSFNWAQEAVQRTGLPAITKSAGKVVPAANSKTLFGINKNLIKAGFGLTTAYIILKESGSAKTFSEFQLVEGMDKLGYVRTRAVEAGDSASVAEIDIMMDELLNQTFWQDARSRMPWFGGNVGTQQNQEAAKLANDVWKRIGEYSSSGSSSSDDWTLAREQRVADEIALTDYYNEQRRIAQENARIADINARNEDAQFWKDYKEELNKMELEQAEKIADFWEEYAKKKAEYEAHKAATYSSLGFGLL